MRTFTFCLIHIVAFISLTSIIVARKKEALFWNWFEQFCETSQTSILTTKPCLNWYVFKLSMYIASMFLPTIRVAFMFLQKSEDKFLSFMALTLLHIMLIRVVVMKLIYFTGKLELCLDHLRLLLSYQIVPIGGDRCLQILWRLCWRMSKLIKAMVGLPMALLCVLFVSGTILNTYTVVIYFNNKKLEIYAILAVIGITIEIFVVSKSCHNCFNCYRCIKGLVHKLQSGFSEFTTESLTLQLMHQNISFSPMQMFTIDHIFVVSVSTRFFTAVSQN